MLPSLVDLGLELDLDGAAGKGRVNGRNDVAKAPGGTAPEMESNGNSVLKDETTCL